MAPLRCPGGVISLGLMCSDGDSEACQLLLAQGLIRQVPVDRNAAEKPRPVDGGMLRTAPENKGGCLTKYIWQVQAGFMEPL